MSIKNNCSFKEFLIITCCKEMHVKLYLHVPVSGQDRIALVYFFILNENKGGIDCSEKKNNLDHSLIVSTILSA